MTQKPVMHSAHWGAFHAERSGDQLLIEPFGAIPTQSAVAKLPSFT